MTRRKPHFVFVPAPTDGEFDLGRFFIDKASANLLCGREIIGGTGLCVSFGDDVFMIAPERKSFAESVRYSLNYSEASLSVTKPAERSTLLEEMIASGKSFDPNADVMPIMYEIIRTSRDRAYIDGLVSSISPGKNHDHHAVMFLRLTSVIKDDLPSWPKLRDELRASISTKSKKRAEKMLLGL